MSAARPTRHTMPEVKRRCPSCRTLKGRSHFRAERVTGYVTKDACTACRRELAELRKRPPRH